MKRTKGKDAKGLRYGRLISIGSTLKSEKSKKHKWSQLLRHKPKPVKNQHSCYFFFNASGISKKKDKDWKKAELLPTK